MGQEALGQKKEQFFNQLEKVKKSLLTEQFK
jgi:hypothetical protein